MRGAPVRGQVLTDGVGVVERGGHGFNAGDLVHARGLRGTWADRAPLEADATRVVKLPPATPVARAAASFAAAATAYGLLRDVDAGDVVIHLGAEGAVGQCVAQICGARGAKALGLVSGDVLDPEDAVDAGEGVGCRGTLGEEAEQGSPSHGRADMGAALAYVVVRINAAANACSCTIITRIRDAAHLKN